MVRTPVTAASLPRLAVDRLPDQVRVAVVPRVLLDHVQEDPPEAEVPEAVGGLGHREPVEAHTAGRQGLVEDGVRTAYCLVEQGEELLGGVVLRGVPLPVAVGV